MIGGPPPRDRWPAWAALIAGAAVVVLVTACGAATPIDPTASPAGTIEQPQVPGDLPVAPESARVDLGMPAFSDPTRITNPLFPVSRQESVLLLGEVDGQAFRTEVTLLDHPRVIDWDGQRVAALVSQYVAYLDARIHEVAYDFYAQADDGSVWYFGEDVFNYTDGAITDTHGTWLAGVDGPAAMIMPAEPQVGDVYRPENIPGFVFEEVTVTSVDETLEGPFGPIEGGLVISELHMDGSTEEKFFAPGYGEFYTEGGGDVEALVLAVPTDALNEPMPPAVESLADDAVAVFEAVTSGEWDAASGATERLSAAWAEHAAGATVPRLVAPELDSALASLTVAVSGQDSTDAAQSAIDVARLAVDLQLLHRPRADVDLDRLDLWTRQLLVDLDAGDTGAITGDYFSLDIIRDRIAHDLSEADRAEINVLMEELNGALGDEDLAVIAELADALHETIAGIASG